MRIGLVAAAAAGALVTTIVVLTVVTVAKPARPMPVAGPHFTTAPPASRTAAGDCVAHSRHGHSDRWGRPGVDTGPHAVIAIWLPGMNDDSCRTVLTRASATIARHLASLIDNAPAVPSEVVCPDDDGTAVQLDFVYADGTDEEIDVAASGCRGLTAPSREVRAEPDGMIRILRTIAPPSWRRHVSD